jgi:tellurite resistance protein
MTDPSQQAAALERLTGALAEDALLVVASGTLDGDALDALSQRRAQAYEDIVAGAPQPRMLVQFDAWLIAMARALAPIAPPAWIPMMDVVREKVTLEIGARGLRSLFSSKPSDKQAARVLRTGSLAVRALRAVYAADGALDAEDRTMIAAVVAALGLPENEALALSNEPPVLPETLDVYGEIEHGVARAIVRGAWLAAASDGIDPREEQAIRVIAQKLGVAADEAEMARKDAQERVEARSKVGAAAVDAVRYVLADRAPGPGVRLAALVGSMMVPRRWRNESLASVGQGAPVTLARRHEGLAGGERQVVLAAAWAAALAENPTLGRRALLQSRWERVAADLGEDDARPREVVERWIQQALAGAARAWT